MGRSFLSLSSLHYRKTLSCGLSCLFSVSVLFDFTILTARVRDGWDGIGAARGMDGIVGKGRGFLRGLRGLAGFAGVCVWR